MFENNQSVGGSISTPEELVATSDTGSRKLEGLSSKILLGTAAWSLFQLWIASPLTFTSGFGVFSAT